MEPHFNSFYEQYYGQMQTWLLKICQLQSLIKDCFILGANDEFVQAVSSSFGSTP